MTTQRKNYALKGAGIIGLLAVSVVTLVYMRPNVNTQWPRPFDPAKTVDISGVVGVSTKQQAWGEDLIKNTAKDLTEWSDYAYALENGYKLIDIPSSGNFVHLVNVEYLQDDIEFNSTKVESLVYAREGDTYILNAAMYVAAGAGTQYDRLKLLGGNLVQWHLHEKACFEFDTYNIYDFTTSEVVTCPNGSVPIERVFDTPMMHVWIVPNECGVFAAIETSKLLKGSTYIDEDKRVDLCQN